MRTDAPPVAVLAAEEAGSEGGMVIMQSAFESFAIYAAFRIIMDAANVWEIGWMTVGSLLAGTVLIALWSQRTRRT